MEKDFQSAPKRFWQTIRHLRRGKRGYIQAVYSKGGTLLTSTEEVIGWWKNFEELLNPTTPSMPRNESPGRIRHPVHSVQRLFTKSHSLPSGGRWSSDDNLDSDSTYRTPSVMSRHPLEHLSHCYPLDPPEHLSHCYPLDPPELLSHCYPLDPPEHLSHCYPLDAVQAHLAGDLMLKTSRSNNDGKCSACDGVAMS
ncbi:hypothetical protein NHX12_015465 [Muraenolepis orangiensis]|uniref:Uncharacterized protein n=1 Tax=Muraenolepis orangiensis TaxID=630683 RepID=A0A9Q0DAG2_9TELE|nr:hypothetical protein NHX12_015465 [Muraenolepis orangiensis]